MKEALRFCGDVHKQYYWFHITAAMLLLLTSLFWYVIPLYIISYGDFASSFLLRIFLLFLLNLYPSFFMTIHCWFISFGAAKKWVEQQPEKNKWIWLLIFQSIAYMMVILFTVFINSLFSVIDFLVKI